MSRAAKIFRMGLLPGLVAVTLSFGVSQALAAPQDGPVGSSRTARYCLPGDVTTECMSGIHCCDRYGCTCGYP